MTAPSGSVVGINVDLAARVEVGQVIQTQTCLPAPQPGVYLVVSMVVPPVAAARGRWTGDLLTPGQQARDSAGRIIGCRSLVRYVP